MRVGHLCFSLGLMFEVIACVSVGCHHLTGLQELSRTMAVYAANVSPFGGFCEYGL